MTDHSAALLAAYRLGVQHGGQIEQSLFGSGLGGTSGSAPERQSPAGDQNGGLPLDDTRPDTKGEATGGRGHFPDSRNAKQGPVAWAVVRLDGEITSIAFRIKDAWNHATGDDRVVPLYRQPQRECLVGGWRVGKQPPLALTDEEREVLGRVADDACYRAMDHTEQVVRKLLERAGRIEKATEIGGWRI
jgi:hypothetical protein